MTFFRIATLSASLLSFSAAGAIADISADEVWDDFASLLALNGTLEFADEVRSGDTLTITDVMVKTEVDDASSSTVTMSELSFTELGDGRVRIDLPPAIDISSTTTEGDNSMTVDMVMEPSGMEIIASGDETIDRYDYSGDSLTLRISDMQAEGSGVEEMPISMTVVASDIDGAYDMKGEDPREVSSTSTMSTLTFDVSGEAPEGAPEPGSFALSGEISDITTEGTSTLPMVETGGDIAAMIEAGFSGAGEINYQSGGYRMDGDSPEGSFQLASTVGAGRLDVSIGADGLDYGTENSDVTMEIGGSMIPLPPVALTMAESGARFKFPLVASDASQSMALQLRMIDLVVPETLWSMFDPAGQLQRDPATIELDIVGRGKLEANIFDPEFADSPAPPGEMESVTVNTLRLSLAGAELTGDGAFDFATGPGGVPMPAGTANLMLTGGNQLLDALVAMGLIPEEQAMGARMMVGMFARPGEGEDTLISTIEVKEDGQILANGQRIR